MRACKRSTARVEVVRAGWVHTVSIEGWQLHSPDVCAPRTTSSSRSCPQEAPRGVPAGSRCSSVMSEWGGVIWWTRRSSAAAGGACGLGQPATAECCCAAPAPRRLRALERLSSSRPPAPRRLASPWHRVAACAAVRARSAPCAALLKFDGLCLLCSLAALQRLGRTPARCACSMQRMGS